MPTSLPTDSPVRHPPFRYSDILRVEVDRLAVRESPTRDSRLLRGDRDGKPIGEVRLDTGDFVSVHLGPLVVADTAWYLVWPAEDARLHYSTVNWRLGPGSGPGWVAAAVGETPYLTIHRRPAVTEVEEYAPVGLNVSGSSDYESEPQPRHDLFAVDWAVTAPNPGSACRMQATLVAEDGTAPVVAVNASTTGIAHGPLIGSTFSAPWERSAGGSWDSFSVSVVSGCSWTFRLAPLHHD